MTGLWLISYIFLWIVVAVLCFLVTGLLQQLGHLQQHLDERVPPQGNDSTKESIGRENDSLPTISQDGPSIGSIIPAIMIDACTNTDTLTHINFSNEYGTLILFMSAGCKSCQELVSPLNQFVDDQLFKGQVIVILRANESSFRAFLSLFPIHAPVICDEDRTISMGFNIHLNPFGLFYGPKGELMRKGLVLNYEAFLALQGDSTVSPETLKNIYPMLGVTT